MTESNKDILRAGYAAFNRQDMPGIVGLFDENIEWTEPEWVYGPPCGTLHGRDEVLHKVFEPIAEQFLSLHVGRSIACGCHGLGLRSARA